MKLRISFDTLDAAMRAMGAVETAWSDDARLEDLKIRLETGIELELDEVEITPDGLLSYKGEQVLLYIKSTGRDRDTLLNTPEKGPRFHVADCTTLDEMREKGRFERYVVTNSLDGHFLVFARDRWTLEKEEIKAALKVCKNCLRKLDYKGYSSGGRKSAIWKSFDIEEFFLSYRSQFRSRPTHTDKTAPAPGYSDDWADISRRYRENMGWCCEVCDVDCGGQKKLLHVHHKNGVKGDNRWVNLQALCVLCHSEQPSHQHMRVKPDERNMIKRLRARGK
ncbi:hypothetical protein SH611_19345 [Geminicoccaceae bacterium 1502E]|nr:hypothetical protein [Geminicoccaceae bacterium 1502E]